MGVRGLQTFIEKNTDACYEVNIARMVKVYRSSYHTDPVIVVDGLSCLKLWYGDLDRLSGIEVRLYKQRLLDFVNAFKAIHAELVFFFDGMTVSKKRERWIERRCRDVQAVFDVFDQLSLGRMPSYDLVSLTMPAHLGVFTAVILKHCTNCKVFNSVDECDEEIILYVQRYKCFAILAQDSDYVINSAGAHYLSIQNLNIDKMTTLIYDTNKLVKSLFIRVDQLPLLAALMGNDIMSFEDLKPFHSRICAPGKVFTANVVGNICSYIRTLSPSLPEATANALSYKVFGNSSAVQKIMQIIESYNPKFKLDDYPDGDNYEEIMKLMNHLHRTCNLGSMIYSIFKYKVYEAGAAIEDFRYNYFIPGALLLQPLRQSLYGILLFNKKSGNDQPLTVQEWTVHTRTSFFKSSSVSPIYPKGTHPGLLKLWTDKSSDILKSKWALFLEAVYGYVVNDNIEKWTLIPNSSILATATIFYMKDKGKLNDWETHAIIATVVEFIKSQDSVPEFVKYGIPDLRAMQISSVFYRAFVIMYTLYGACGYPTPLDQNIAIPPFEGPLFQMKYKQLKNCDSNNFKQFVNGGNQELYESIEEIIFKR